MMSLPNHCPGSYRAPSRFILWTPDLGPVLSTGLAFICIGSVSDFWFMPAPFIAVWILCRYMIDIHSQDFRPVLARSKKDCQNVRSQENTSSKCDGSTKSGIPWAIIECLSEMPTETVFKPRYKCVDYRASNTMVRSDLFSSSAITSAFLLPC